MSGESGAGPPPASDPFRRERVEIPSGGDLARQLVIVGVTLVAWFGAFEFAMNLPTETVRSARADERRAERMRAAAAADSAVTDSIAGEEASAEDAAAASAAEESGPADRGAVVEGPATSEPISQTTPPPAAATEPAVTVTPPSEPVSAEPDPVTAIEDEAAKSNMPDVSDHPPVSFTEEVMPILESRCVQCHGKARDDGTLRIEEGLDLRTHETILAGSTWGSVVVPGDPVGSYMLEMILDGEMPDEGPRLLPHEVRILAAWIAQGAPNN